METNVHLLMKIDTSELKVENEDNCNGDGDGLHKNGQSKSIFSTGDGTNTMTKEGEPYYNESCLFTIEKLTNSNLVPQTGIIIGDTLDTEKYTSCTGTGEAESTNRLLIHSKSRNIEYNLNNENFTKNENEIGKEDYHIGNNVNDSISIGKHQSGHGDSHGHGHGGSTDLSIESPNGDTKADAQNNSIISRIESDGCCSSTSNRNSHKEKINEICIYDDYGGSKTTYHNGSISNLGNFTYISTNGYTINRCAMKDNIHNDRSKDDRAHNHNGSNDYDNVRDKNIYGHINKVDNVFDEGSNDGFSPIISFAGDDNETFSAIPDATEDEDMLIQERIMKSKSELVSKLNSHNRSHTVTEFMLNNGMGNTNGNRYDNSDGSLCESRTTLLESKEVTLFEACRQGCYEKVKEILILNSNTNVDMADGDCWSCLHETSIRNCQFTPITELLLQNGANPNLRDKKGETPLHGAVLFHLVDNIKLLLKYNADYNICNNTNVSPLKLATYLKDNEILLLFGQPIIEDKIEKKKKKKRKRNSLKDFILPLSTSPSILKKRRTLDERSSSSTMPLSKKRINFSL